MTTTPGCTSPIEPICDSSDKCFLPAAPMRFVVTVIRQWPNGRSTLSFARHEPPERWLRRAPQTAARQIEQDAGDREQRHQRSRDHERDLAGPTQNRTAVDVEHIRDDLLADRLVSIAFRGDQLTGDGV